jgi:hypothetical protein
MPKGPDATPVVGFWRDLTPRFLSERSVNLDATLPERIKCTNYAETISNG